MLHHLPRDPGVQGSGKHTISKTSFVVQTGQNEKDQHSQCGKGVPSALLVGEHTGKIFFVVKTILTETEL